MDGAGEHWFDTEGAWTKGPQISKPNAPLATAKPGIYYINVASQILFFAVFGGALILIVILARLHPGSGADLLDWRQTRSYETEIELRKQGKMDEKLFAKVSKQ